METWGKIVVVILLLGMTSFVQFRISKLRSTVPGLVIPFLILAGSFCMLFQDLQHIKNGEAEALTVMAAVLYFALYNIPTILFLCIYNYCQRMRLAKGR